MKGHSHSGLLATLPAMLEGHNAEMEAGVHQALSMGKGTLCNQRAGIHADAPA